MAKDKDIRYGEKTNLTNEEIADLLTKRTQLINDLNKILLTTPFMVEFQVKDNPKGIRIIHEVTREEMKALLERQRGLK